MKKFFLCIVCLYYSVASAKEANVYSNKLNHCKLTKGAMDDYEPEEFQLSNNLLRRTGQKAMYSGARIVIKGKLMDERCVPVSDAKVYLWQVGSDGKYPYRPLRDRVNKKMFNRGSNSTFTGSGIATTNNKGEFYFVTIYPGGTNAKYTNLNIRVEHRDLGQLQTKLYFSNAVASTGQCAEVSSALSAALDSSQTYNFEVVMKGQTLRKY
jgi:protocatechuate 3,4-dioxygenase beta subunit